MPDTRSVTPSTKEALDIRWAGAAPWELTALTALSAVLFVLYVTGAYDLARSAGAAALALVLMTGAISMLRKEPRVIWTPMFWFRVTTAVYFGLGTLVLLIMNPFTLATVRSFYPMQPADLAKLTLISAVGSLATFVGASVVERWLKQRRGSSDGLEIPAGLDTRRAMLAGGIWFFGIGAAVKYAIALPYQLGLFQGIIVPGALLSVSQAILAGIYLLAAWCFRYRPSFAPVILLLLAIEMIVGLAAFSKSNTMFPVVMVMLAWVQQRPSATRLAAMVAAIMTTYLVAGPLVEDGRLALLRRYGTHAQGTLSERVDILTSDNAEYRRYSAFQGPLARISYANAATYAIYRYDTGRPVDSFRSLYIVLVPRVLWPNKPNLSNFGTDFNFLATGNDKSSSSPGLMAEAYWNGGYVALVAIMAGIGALLFGWGVFTLRVFARGDFLFMPVVFFGMKTGARTDGAIVADIISTLVFTLALYFGLVLIKRFFGGEGRKAQSPAALLRTDRRLAGSVARRS